ncbi:permease of the major facilitator superfamily protein [Corynebacterium renale]|uniref:MFS transporter n=1 Tax=Corynebacterium renale TaxID=1724 RepID=UPI000DA2EDD7|nr:MFS transporter [Corynebacterium renale]SQG65220.1 permease of the major facilitator superfamily protein [Corynebacterium renale]STC98372.1 permease of the major facilitator superfamily protein [Corynebacterium renale]
MDIRTLIDNSRMSGYQWLIIILALFLNALDGFDLVAMSFTANPVTQEFGLSGLQLGSLFSAALLGVGVGSVALGPAADRWGRRTMIIVAGIIDLAGLFATTFAHSFPELLAFRFITGIGVGGILACVTVVTSEFSNLRYRGLAMSIYASGYGIGAALCGTWAAHAIPEYGWRSIYLTGAGLTLLALVLTVVILPESTDYLRTRQPKNWEARTAAIARRLGLPEQSAIPVTLPEQTSSEKKKASIFGGGYLGVTLRIWAAFSLITFGFNFANSWTPKLLTETGMTENQGIIGGIALSFGGTIGSLIYGALTTKLDARRTLIGFSTLSAIILVVFIFSTSIPAIAFVAGVGVGMLLNGCVTGMYTVTPAAYAPHLRATGVGAAIGASRLGAVVAPTIIGALYDAGWSPTSLYITAAIVVVFAGVALFGMKPAHRVVVSEPAREAVAASA